MNIHDYGIVKQTTLCSFSATNRKKNQKVLQETTKSHFFAEEDKPEYNSDCLSNISACLSIRRIKKHSKILKDTVKSIQWRNKFYPIFESELKNDDDDTKSESVYMCERATTPFSNDVQW